MATLETKGIAEEKRDKLTEAGYTLEYLGQAFWNVSCEDEDADDLTDLLDKMNIEWRLV